MYYFEKNNNNCVLHIFLCLLENCVFGTSVRHKVVIATEKVSNASIKIAVQI